MTYSRLKAIRGPIFKLTMMSCAAILVIDGAHAEIAVSSSGVDNTRNVIFSVNTDRGQAGDTEGAGYLAIFVDQQYNYGASSHPSTQSWTGFLRQVDN